MSKRENSLQVSKMDESRRKRRKKLVLACAAAVSGYYELYMVNNPCLSPTIFGAACVREILGEGNDQRCQELCHMDLRIFRKLCKILRRKNLLLDTAGIKVEEQMLMFLYTICNNVSNRNVQERFEHSGETVSRHFKTVLNAIFELSFMYIHLPSSEYHDNLFDQWEFAPFKDCIGLIDGMHIPVTIATERQGPYRNRMGSLSQNVMTACSLDQRFLYILAGWEGSASNAIVLQAALESGFTIPEGKYYLVNGGYSNTSHFVSPYNGLRYSLHHFGSKSPPPQNPRELFNLRHATLRSLIDRSIGVLKKRFPVLNVGTSYPYESQTKLIIAACALHNFVLVENKGEDWLFAEYDNEVVNQAVEEDHFPERDETDQNGFGDNVLRDHVANMLWEDYCLHS